MQRRADLTELMDDPNVDTQALAASLRFIRRVNRHLGGTRAVMGHVREWSRGWARGDADVVTFLDVATGSADIPLALLNWAGGKGFRVHVTCLDLHAGTLELAQQHVAQTWRGRGEPPLAFVRGDALALPFGDGSVDYVLCSMFLHHLSDANALAAVREMVRVARRGIIVNDLERSFWARVGIYLLTLFADRVDKHDARVSVQKAWVRSEVERWRTAAGIPWASYHHHVPARFTLAGERVRVGTYGRDCASLGT